MTTATRENRPRTLHFVICAAALALIALTPIVAQDTGSVQTETQPATGPTRSSATAQSIVTTRSTAATQPTTAPAASQPAATQPTAALPNTVCPVMRRPALAEHWVEYQGKRVHFCCDGCPRVFLASPEKYLGLLPQFGGTQPELAGTEHEHGEVEEQGHDRGHSHGPADHGEEEAHQHSAPSPDEEPHSQSEGQEHSHQHEAHEGQHH